MNWRYLVFVIIILALLFFFGVSKNTKNPIQNNKMLVSASFYPLAFLAEHIGGDKVNVFTVTPAGSEPHDYEPSAQDIAKISDSKALLLNGAHLETWAKDIKQNIDPKRTTIITMSSEMTAELLLNDPHLWNNPAMYKVMASVVEQTFEKADPENAIYYATNLAIVDANLEVLDQEYRSGLANCAKRDIITANSAFAYLAQEYNLNQVSIAGLSPDAEPSPKQLADIATFAKKNDVKYIFFESLVSPRLADTIPSEIGAKTLVLNPLEGLTPEDIAAGKDYFSVMRSNLNNLKIALECQN